MLVQLQNVGRRIGARWLFRRGALSVQQGDRVGIVGPNGSGKTTLLKLIAGDESPDEGEIQTPRDTRLGMLRQEIDPNLKHSIETEAGRALSDLEAIENEMRELERSMTDLGDRGEALPSELAERYDELSAKFAHSGGYEREARIARVLAGLGFDESARKRPLSSFSGGWLMRVELAKLFLSQPQVMLLDEPTNHLDLPSIQWFEDELDSFTGALLIVSHDRTFLRRHVGRVVELDGRGNCQIYEGDYDRYQTQRAERHAQLLAQKANQDRDIAQMERFVERFRAKATKARQAQSRIKALEKIERIEVEEQGTRSMRLRIPDPPRSGEAVISLNGIHKSYGDNHIYEGVEFHARRGECIALAGPNGAGKSTLLRIVAGVLKFEAGERKLGHNVELAFFAQHQLDSLSANATILEELSQAASHEDLPRLRGHLGAFLFSGDDVEKKIGVLSGGEKARVALAKMLLRPSNLLVLDEPTNHLDIESCEILENALSGYTGTIIFVSHDRSFINKLATRLVEVEHGALSEYQGNYDDYLYRKHRLTQQAGQPASKSVTPPAPHPSAQTAEPSATPPVLSKEDRKLERERRKTRDRANRRIKKLEDMIQKQEEQLGHVGLRLADPEVSSDAERLTAIQTEQSELEEAIRQLYRDWERAHDELTALEDIAQAP